MTDVGDRYVLAEMRSSGAMLGGEQSGHVIALDRQTTGDGLMTAAMLLMALARADEPLEDAARLVVKYPQRLVNVRADRRRLPDAAPVWEAVRGGRGGARRGRPRRAARVRHRAARARDGGGGHGRAL